MPEEEQRHSLPAIIALVELLWKQQVHFYGDFAGAPPSEGVCFGECRERGEMVKDLRRRHVAVQS